MKKAFAIVVLLALSSSSWCLADEISLVSQNSNGEAADSHNYYPVTSRDGRYVAFESHAHNLTADTVTYQSIFVRDNLAGTTTLVNVSSNGEVANDYSYTPAISGDGRYVAFSSYATNLVAGDTNDLADIFLHDLQTHETTRISISSAGTQANSSSSTYYPPSLSDDGRYIAFVSYASNLVTGDTNATADVFVRDREAGTTERASFNTTELAENGPYVSPSISADGRFVAFASSSSVWLRDRVNRNWREISKGRRPSLSQEGRYIVYQETSSSCNIIIYDLQTGLPNRILPAASYSDYCYDPDISGDGRFVVFSTSKRLISQDIGTNEDVYFYDSLSDSLKILSVSATGELGDSWSRYPTISADGHYVAFESTANNLAGGGFATQDIFGVKIEDSCPNDPIKLDPGYCGCGFVDDADHDFVPDCQEQCPADPLKTAPGQCGCGVSDRDRDSDGTPDCFDQCPVNPYKTEPGLCGCGALDTDTDSDGLPNCKELMYRSEVRTVAVQALGYVQQITGNGSASDAAARANLTEVLNFLQHAANNGFTKKQQKLINGAIKPISQLLQAANAKLVKKRKSAANSALKKLTKL